MTVLDPASSWRASLDHVADVDLRQALIRLFERADDIASKSYEKPVVLFVSRRMTCLYEMVARAGFEGLVGCDVISDRALGGGMGDIAGRHILLIDDALILGTTLTDIYDELVELTGDRSLVTTMVATIDEDRVNRSLANHIQLNYDGVVEGSTKRLEGLAYDLAACLYRQGVPYFTDFPTVTRASVPFEFFEEILRTPGWRAASVTPPRAFAGDRQGWSLIPTDATLDALRRRGIHSATALAELWKVRVYADRASDGDDRKNVTVVPIGIPGAALPPLLDDVLEDFAVGLDVDLRKLGCFTWKDEAKHRLVQMYLSTLALTELWSAHDDALGSLTAESLDDRVLSTFFGQATFATIRDLLDKSIRAYREADPETQPPPAFPLPHFRSELGKDVTVRRALVATRLLLDETRTQAAKGKLNELRTAVAPHEPAQGDIATVDLVWVHFILSVFGRIDVDLERPQQDRLRFVSYDEYRSSRDADADPWGYEPDDRRVLKKGLSFFDIVEAVRTSSVVGTWNVCAESLAIDVGNDLGIAVPATMVGAGQSPVSRQYRSGETASLAASPFCEHSDRLWEEILADRDAVHAGRAAILVHEFDHVARKAVPGTIARAWIGDLREVEGEQVRAVVTSDLEWGHDDTALVPLRWIRQSDVAHLEPGANFEWVLFDTVDDDGDPDPRQIVRVRSSTER